MFENLLNRSGLSHDRLKNFLLVAEAGSMVAASEGDPIKQSLYSRQIRELEEFFGAQLTQRKGKSISLSPSGRRLAGLIREHFQGLSDFLKEQHQLPKQFVFAAGASILDWLLIPTIKQIREVLEGASLRMENHRSKHCVEAIREGALDFAIIRQDAIAAKLPHHVIGKLSYVLCIGRNLSQHEHQPSKNWHRLPLALPVEGGSFYHELHRVTQQAGHSLAPAIQCQSFTQMKQLVESGDYAAILPTIGLQGLQASGANVISFPLLKEYSRNLCLHWNERQMTRRCIEPKPIKALALKLKQQLKLSSQ